MANERMTARQWLGRARGINKELDMLEKALQEARDAATRITQNYESDGAQTSKDPHKLDRLGEYADMIREKQEALFDIKREITGAIYKLQDNRQRTVLFEYYINCCQSWEEVAAKTHYSWRTTMYIRKKALSEFEKVCIDLHIDPVI